MSLFGVRPANFSVGFFVAGIILLIPVVSRFLDHEKIKKSSDECNQNAMIVEALIFSKNQHIKTKTLQRHGGRFA